MRPFPPLIPAQPPLTRRPSQSTWIIQSTYWLTIFPLRGASALFDLAQLISLILVWGRAKLFGRTPREIREWTTPPAFDFPVYFSNHLLMLVVRTFCSAGWGDGG